MKVLRGHKGDVYAVVLLEDIVVSSGYDKTIKVWNSTSGQLLRTLNGHTDIVRSLAVYSSERDPYVISGSWDNTIRLWDVHTGKLLRTLTGHTNRVKVVTSYGGAEVYILSGSDDCTMRLWSAQDECELKRFSGHSQPVLCVAVSNGVAKYAASGSADSSVRVWDLGDNCPKRTKVLNAHCAPVTGVVFSSIDEQTLELFSAGEDRVIMVWDYDRGYTIRRLNGHGGPVTAIDVLQWGTTEFLVSCSQDGTVRLWDSRANKEVRKEDLGGDGGLLFAVTHSESEQGTRLAVAGSDGFLRIFPRLEDIFLMVDIAGIGLKVDFQSGASVASTRGGSRVLFRQQQQQRGHPLTAEGGNLPKLTKHRRWNGRDPIKKRKDEEAYSGGKEISSESNPALKIVKPPVHSNTSSPNNSPTKDQMKKGGTRLGQSLSSPTISMNKGSTSAVTDGQPKGTIAVTIRPKVAHEVQSPIPDHTSAASSDVRSVPEQQDLRRQKLHTAPKGRRRHLPKLCPQRRKDFILTVSQYSEPRVKSGNGILQVHAYPPSRQATGSRQPTSRADLGSLPIG